MKKSNIMRLMCSFVIVALLLLSYDSFAVYTADYFNFFDGISPYYTGGSIDTNNTYFYPQDGSLNTLQGQVVSFDDTFMSGSIPQNAIPLVNGTHITGKVFELPSGCCTCLYLEDMILYCNTEFSYSRLGWSVPNLDGTVNISNLSVANNSGNQVCYTNSGPISSEVPFNTFDSVFIGTSVSTSINATRMGQILLLVNDSDDSIYFSNERDLLSNNPVVTFEGDYISTNEICFLFYSVAFGTSSSSYTGYYFAIPHIKGDIDVYTAQFSRFYQSGSIYYKIIYYDNVIGSLGTTDTGNIYYGIDNTTALRQFGFPFNIATSTADKSPNFCPFFIDSVYSTQKEAVFIKDGYVSILNYDELVKKLKEAGVGSTDLSRIIELLDLLNSGGATGEQAKELIGLLDNLHNGVVSDGDHSFNQIQSIFDDYSFLFDFDNDLHWIVTANNALFNYFAGFVLLCVVLLVFDRIMRG